MKPDPQTADEISLGTLYTLQQILADHWMPCERVNPGDARILEGLGLVRYHGPVHGYAITESGEAVAKSRPRVTESELRGVVSISQQNLVALLQRAIEQVQSGGAA